MTSHQRPAESSSCLVRPQEYPVDMAAYLFWPGLRPPRWAVTPLPSHREDVS
jgi:hypothetical protein